jgi:uncharacterized protein
MNRIVFWLAIVGFGFLLWRGIQLAQRKQSRWRDQRAEGSRPAAKDGDDRPPDSPPEQLARGEAMLKCAHCGIYLPASEALERRGLSYCSTEHRDARPV